MRDFYSNVLTALALVPAVYSASVNGAAVDMRKATGAVFTASCGAIIGAAAFSVKLQESDDGVTWTDVPSKYVTTNAPAVLVQNTSYRIGYGGNKAWARPVFTLASGTSAALASTAIMRPVNRPVA